MNDLAPFTTERRPIKVKLRVEDFLLLDDAGAFVDYARTELIEGQVVTMSPEHRPHSQIKSRLHIALARALAEQTTGLEALVEGSVSMPPYNAPQPDISVTREPDGEGFIPLASLALVIEVAATTLRNDLVRKRRIYAREGVPEYWVVDVERRVFHQMWRPTGATYAERREVPFGDPVQAATIPGLTVATGALVDRHAGG